MCDIRRLKPGLRITKTDFISIRIYQSEVECIFLVRAHPRLYCDFFSRFLPIAGLWMIFKDIQSWVSL